MKKCIIETVFERDIDLYIINKFLYDNKFKELFLDKINKCDFNVKECIHSYLDNDGESDITVILEKDEEKIALLIEDKIDAIAMPDQRNRYSLRGDKGIVEGKVMDANELITLAKLPSRQELLGMLAGALLGNISKLAVGLDQVRLQKEQA